MRVDSGMSASDWMLQTLANLLEAPVDRPKVREATALGAAWLARRATLPAGDQAEFWQLDRSFQPVAQPESRAARRVRWRRAVEAVMMMESAR